MWSSYSVFTISVNNHLAYYNLFSPKKLLYVFIFSQTCFLLINIFKEVIPLFVFSFVYPRVSPLLFIYFILFHSFYHLFYFILLLLILMFFFFSFSSSLFFIFNFPRGWHDCFAVYQSLFSPFILLSSFLLFLPSNSSSSYTYTNSILRLT